MTLHLGLSLALREATTATRVATIILDNQSVIKDMKSHGQALNSLLDKQRAFTILMYLERAYPGLQIVIRWCPGHTGVKGNEVVDKLAQKTAKKSLQDTNRRPPGIAAFQAVIKEWVRHDQATLTDKQRLRLGHNHQGARHLISLKTLTKPSISAITQPRSGHAPLNHHLFKYQQRHDPACECETGVENVDHFLFICPRYTKQRHTLHQSLKKLKLSASKSCLTNIKSHAPIAEYCTATWRLKDRWEWAKVSEEPFPTKLHPPRD